ncbi:MAG TPA: VOC family protein [Gaiellaceae bacterium]|nr:VOC family protein [Gaiellaceae bacterium]
MATVSTKSAVVGWHELVAPDVEPAKAFYTGLLGWTFSVWRPGEADYPMIHVHGRDHGGFFARDRAPHWLVYVEVDDVDAVLARVPALGGHVFLGPEDIEDVGRYGVMADPENAVLAVITPSEPAVPPSKDVFCWDELATTDVAAAKRFYCDLLGWRVVESMPGYWVFRSGGDDVAGLTAKPSPGPAPTWVTYLKVEDTAAIVRRALELGATVASEPRQAEGVGCYAVLVDTVGAAFGVVGPEV